MSFAISAGDSDWSLPINARVMASIGALIGAPGIPNPLAMLVFGAAGWRPD